MILIVFDRHYWQEHIMASAKPGLTHSFTGFSAVLILRSTLMRGTEAIVQFYRWVTEAQGYQMMSLKCFAKLSPCFTSLGSAPAREVPVPLPWFRGDGCYRNTQTVCHQTSSEIRPYHNVLVCPGTAKHL